MSNTIPVIEIFGPVIAGEGPVIGNQTMFVRTGGCDFSCSFCDTKYSWDGSVKAKQMRPDEIVAELDRLAPQKYTMVTISGGNPALIGEPMGELIYLLRQWRMADVVVETQGSKYQEWFDDADYLVLSPKPPSSKMKTDWDMLDHIFEEICFMPHVKIVVFNDEDYAYAKELFTRFSVNEMHKYLQVGNEDVSLDVVQGVQRAALLSKLKWLTEKVLADPDEIMREVRVLPQLHTLMYSNIRGK